MYPQSVLSKNIKNINFFQIKFSIFTAEKKKISLYIAWATFLYVCPHGSDSSVASCSQTGICNIQPYIDIICVCCSQLCLLSPDNQCVYTEIRWRFEILNLN